MVILAGYRFERALTKSAMWRGRLGRNATIFHGYSTMPVACRVHMPRRAKALLVARIRRFLADRPWYRRRLRMQRLTD